MKEGAFAQVEEPPGVACGLSIHVGQTRVASFVQPVQNSRTKGTLVQYLCTNGNTGATLTSGLVVGSGLASVFDPADRRIFEPRGFFSRPRIALIIR